MSANSKPVVALLATVITVLVSTFGVTAQQKPSDLQERARVKFQQLHERMQSLQAKKQAADTAGGEERNVEDGRILAAGNRFIQEKRIHEDMQEIRDLLDAERFDEALTRMKSTDEELGQLLDLLMNRDLDLQKLLEEIERLEGFKKRVDDLLDDQLEEKREAARTEDLEQHLRDVEKAKREVAALLDGQKNLRERTDPKDQATPGPDVTKQLSTEQGELEDAADALAKELEKIDDEAARLGMKKPEDAKAAEAQPKPGDDSSSDGGGGGSGSGSCAGNCQSAAKSMGKSEKKLGENQPQSSLKDQNDAIEQLEKTLEDLEELSEETRRELLKLPFDQQVRAQEQTRMDTDRLAKDMESSEKSENGTPSKPTPGRKNVENAVPKQKAAAGSLKEQKPSKAKQDQQDAAEELAEAKKQLEEALAQLRQQLQDEVLRSLEERFAAMLAAQKELSQRTIAARRLQDNAVVADGHVPEAVAARCAELAVGEFELGGEAADALKLLEEDATTAVFPVIVTGLRDDLNAVGDRLQGNKCGRATQEAQAEIVQTLKELLDALRRQIEANEGQCGECNGQPPLVPLSAEFKLVLAKQKRVNKRTKSYDTDIPEQLRVTEEAKDCADGISRDQSRVEDLLRRLANKMNKENAAGSND